MYHADLIGGLLARMARVKRIFWGIRHSNLESSHTGKSTIAVAKLCALLSFWVPSGIVSCSIKGIEVHKAFGYDKKKFTFIPNGYDPNEFIPNQVVGNEIRKSLQIPDGIPILGMVARYNVQKDHGNLLLALKQLKLNCVDFRCALIGAGMTRENTELMDLLASLGINSNVLLLGQRNDIPAIMNSLDIHVLSSSCGEGFPNVLCEAMACGTVCVTTDVGDAATIVSDTGWIVPPRSPDLLFRALLEAIGELLETRSHWRQRKNLVRQRITKNYSIDEMTNRFQSLWSNVGQ
jgi:glycosyltransferase involved in cell wall biosynthesis